MFKTLLTRAPQKHSLHIGINRYDREYYGGNIDLQQCVYDAQRFNSLAKHEGYNASLMLDDEATIDALTDYLANAAKLLRKGDILFITNSSHGTYDDQVAGSGRAKRMTAICLHDGIFWDYSFREALKKFRAGVTIIWVADCCFAESNWRNVTALKKHGLRTRYTPLPKEVLVVPTQGDKRQIKATMFTYASSNIYQVSYEDENGGVFTTAILRALREDPNLSYYQVNRRASELIADEYPQSPVFEHVRGANLTGKRFLT